MKRSLSGGRFATVFLFLCILSLTTSVQPTIASLVVPITPGWGGETQGPCQGCNQQTITGSAVNGAAQNTEDGSQFYISFNDPTDGTSYTGTMMTQVVNADNTVSVTTVPVTIPGDGRYSDAIGTNDAHIPNGGTASFSITASNAAGATFSAGWTVRNFHP